MPMKARDSMTLREREPGVKNRSEAPPLRSCSSASHSRAIFAGDLVLTSPASSAPCGCGSFASMNISGTGSKFRIQDHLNIDGVRSVVDDVHFVPPFSSMVM